MVKQIALYCRQGDRMLCNEQMNDVFAAQQGYLHFLKDFQGQREANIPESSFRQSAMSWEESISEQMNYMMGK